MNKKNMKRILTLLIVGILSFNSTNNPKRINSPIKAADTIQDLEVLKKENDIKISELKQQIADSKKQYEEITDDENSKLEYQNILNEKIALQNQNIEYVIGQINSIDDDIEANQLQIIRLEGDIVVQNASIGRNMELFRQRIRASYMSGGDSISAVLSGSSSFYDILSKLELVSKMAEHDDKLVARLEDELEELEKMNDELGHKQDELNEKLDEASRRKQEYAAKLDELQVDFRNTQDELEKLNADKALLEENIEARIAAVAEKEKEQQKIEADIAVIQEKLRQESIAESKRVSQSVAESVAESKRLEELNRPVTQAPGGYQNSSSKVPSQSAPKFDSASGLMLWPVPGYTSHSSFFGWREFDSSDHKAIDIQGNSGGTIAGAAIYAAADGVVATAVNSCTHNYGKNYSCGCGGGYGNYIVLVHNDGVYSTVYAHCQSVLVYANQKVSKGQLIGYVGSTGYSTGSHLHFEVRKNGVQTNPDSYTYENYG